jgi:hypothetical protein
MPIVRQQIPNMHQWTNWEEVFSTQSAWELCDATIEELLEVVFSMQSVPRCDKQPVYSLVCCERVASQ